MIWVFNLGGAKYNFLLKNVQIGFWAYQVFYSTDTECLLRIQPSGRNVNHLSSHGVEVKNGWSCISAPLHAFKVWTETTLSLYKTPPSVILKDGKRCFFLKTMVYVKWSVCNHCFVQQRMSKSNSTALGQSSWQHGIGSGPFTCVRTWR